MVRGYASTTDYTVNWSMNAIENREIDVQDLSERRIKVRNIFGMMKLKFSAKERENLEIK